MRPPAVQGLSPSVAGCFSCRTVTVRIYDVWTLLHQLEGVVVYPRFRVFYQHSATLYVAVRLSVVA